MAHTQIEWKRNPPDYHLADLEVGRFVIHKRWAEGWDVRFYPKPDAGRATRPEDIATTRTLADAKRAAEQVRYRVEVFWDRWCLTERDDPTFATADEAVAHGEGLGVRRWRVNVAV